MKPLLLLAAFILELIAFAGFSTLPYIFEINAFIKLSLAILLFILLITFWSIFMSPKASKKFGLSAHYFSKLVIYSIASLTLLKLLGLTQGIAFIVAVAIDEALLYKHNAGTLIDRQS